MQYSFLNLKLGIAIMIFPAMAWLSSDSTAQPITRTPMAKAQHVSQPLRQIVKIIVNRETHQITLIGNSTDVATVKRLIDSFNHVKRQPPATVVSEKVVLHRQLAANVASLMRNSKSLFADQQGKLTITPLRTPEAIFLSGPPALIKRAKEFIATLDR